MGKKWQAMLATVKAEVRWKERVFHAVKVKMAIEGGKKVEAIADTGAAPTIIAEADVSLKVIGGRLRPAEAKIMQAATGNKFSSHGAAKVAFRLQGSQHRFEHTAQITPGDSVPTLLGVCFWAKYKAVINFKTRHRGCRNFKRMCNTKRTAKHCADTCTLVTRMY